MDTFFALGISYCLGAAAINYSNRDNVRHVEVLESIPRFNKLKDLEQLLDVDRSPLVVAISGKVVSETPIDCEITGLRGVIVEEKEEEHYLRRDVNLQNCKDSTREKQICNIDVSWTRHSSLLSSKCKEVPWYLDDETGRVLVAGACGAADFELPAGNSKFEKAERTYIHETSNNIQLKKILGIKRIERVLPVRTSLTIVGKVYKYADGTIQIQRPYNGPFYVSGKPIDEHIAEFANDARWWENASLSLIVFGACQIAARIYYLLHRGR